MDGREEFIFLLVATLYLVAESEGFMEFPSHCTLTPFTATVLKKVGNSTSLFPKKVGDKYC